MACRPAVVAAAGLPAGRAAGASSGHCPWLIGPAANNTEVTQVHGIAKDQHADNTNKTALTEIWRHDR